MQQWQGWTKWSEGWAGPEGRQNKEAGHVQAEANLGAINHDRLRFSARRC